MNRLILSLILVLFAAPLTIHVQEFIPLWAKGKMPNSKGIELKVDIRNERVYQVGTFGF